MSPVYIIDPKIDPSILPELYCDWCKQPIPYILRTEGSSVYGYQTTEHFLGCEKSPLYQSINQMREEIRELKQRLAKHEPV